MADGESGVGWPGSDVYGPDRGFGRERHGAGLVGIFLLVQRRVAAL